MMIRALFFVFVSNCFQNINVPLQCKADEDLLSNIVDDTIYLAHVIEQPIFRIPNLEYLQRNFVYLLDQK